MSSQKMNKSILKPLPEDYAAVGCLSAAFLKLPLPLAAQVMKMMTESIGHRPIAIYLRSQGLKISDRKVAIMLAEERAARAPLTKELARERIAPEIDQKIDLLDNVMQDLSEIHALYNVRRKNNSDHGMFLKITDRLFKGLELYQKFAGIDNSNDKNDTAQGATQLNAKLADLATKLAGIQTADKDNGIEVEFKDDYDDTTQN